MCCFLFFSDLFCFVSFVQIPRLEYARSDLVSDVPVFTLRALVCARLWIYVCWIVCVFLCVCVSIGCGMLLFVRMGWGLSGP